MTAAWFTHSYETFQQAYLAHLRRVRDQPEFCNSPRGYHSREILGVAYRLVNPRERVIRVPSRRTNIVFNFAEALWYLSGSNSLDFIRFYAPSMDRYSTDGHTLRGTAYGPRIFNCGGAGFDQWDSVVNTLRADPDSKRALIQIFAPEELLIAGNIDVACTIGLQYLVREGQLHAVSFMRANDAYRGAASDVFSFTFLQEVLAHQLDLDVGSYTHIAGSYHLYDNDRERADRVLADPDASTHADPFPAMPAGDNWPAIREVLTYEALLRTGRSHPNRADIERLGLSHYWTQVLALLCLHAYRKHAGKTDPDLFALLDPLYGQLLENCWCDSYATAS
ncbi:thymidylate synthase [Mycobacterium sp. 050134]|uniref:thymidylate synthase n=1 Tax=Mycobacterium sp. 050134 TaxID=3096111 RepID=UPI002ED807E2